MKHDLFKFLFLGLLSIFMFPSVLFAAEETVMILCKNKKEVRTLKVSRNEAKKTCLSIYNKMGKDSVMAEGMNPSTCAETNSKIKSNLEAAGWVCREVKNKTL